MQVHMAFVVARMTNYQTTLTVLMQGMELRLYSWSVLTIFLAQWVHLHHEVSRIIPWLLDRRLWNPMEHQVHQSAQSLDGTWGILSVHLLYFTLLFLCFISFHFLILSYLSFSFLFSLPTRSKGHRSASEGRPRPSTLNDLTASQKWQTIWIISRDYHKSFWVGLNSRTYFRAWGK